MSYAITDLESPSVAFIPRFTIVENRILRVPERGTASTDLNLCMGHCSPRWVAAIHDDEIGIGIGPLGCFSQHVEPHVRLLDLPLHSRHDVLELRRIEDNSHMKKYIGLH
jgi:hypothetical protein